MSKVCTKCGKSFPGTSEYFFRCKSKSTGLRPDCKSCVKSRRKKYYTKTRDKHLKKMREWYEYYKENGLKRDNVTPEEIQEIENRKRLRKKKDSKKTDAQRRHEINNDTLKGFILKLKKYTNTAWRRNYSKNTLSHKYLCCDHFQFKKHLIKTFEDRYSVKWRDDFRKFLHIDHIIPLSKASSREEAIELTHYKNTQFLYSKDNNIKFDKTDFKNITSKNLIDRLDSEGVEYERLN